MSQYHSEKGEEGVNKVKEQCGWLPDEEDGRLLGPLPQTEYLQPRPSNGVCQTYQEPLAVVAFD